MTETNNAESVLERMLREAPGPGQVDHVASICVRDALVAGPDEETVAEACGAVIQSTKKLAAPIWHAARGAIKGLMAACHEAGVDPLPLVRIATDKLLREADDLGGDIGAAAKGAAEGAVEGADLFGLDSTAAVSAAANAALVTSKDLGEGAQEKVFHLVSGRIHSVPVHIDRANRLS